MHARENNLGKIIGLLLVREFVPGSVENFFVFEKIPVYVSFVCSFVRLVIIVKLLRSNTLLLLTVLTLLI